MFRESKPGQWEWYLNIGYLFPLSGIKVVAISGKPTGTRHKINKNIDPMDSFLINDNNKLEGIYRDLPTVSLPLSYDMVITDELEFYEVPEHFFYLFYNNNYFEKGSDIAKLPRTNNFLPFIIAYPDGEGDRIMELSIFNSTLEPIDRLEIASVEKMREGRILISKLFEISVSYVIKVYKLLNGKVIEQLYYQLTESGALEEIRDGRTLAITYQSVDFIHYKIENFIWDYHKNGGLYKRDLAVNDYVVTEDGKLVETDENGEH